MFCCLVGNFEDIQRWSLLFTGLEEIALTDYLVGIRQYGGPLRMYYDDYSAFGTFYLSISEYFSLASLFRQWQSLQSYDFFYKQPKKPLVRYYSNEQQ